MPVNITQQVTAGRWWVRVRGGEQASGIPYFLHIDSQVAGDGLITTMDKKYYLKDHLGSTRKVVDAGGNELESYDYYPFGLMRRASFRGEGTKETFTGKTCPDTSGEKDNETGFYYFGSRYYNAALAGWMVPDPAGQFHSPYSYVGGNTVSVIDPNGEFGILAGALISAAVNSGITALKGGVIVRIVRSGVIGGILEAGTPSKPLKFK